jgi:hypothetical protein
LIKQAKQKVKARKPISRGFLEKYWEIFWMLVYKVFCCCRNTYFGRSIQQGRGMIRREMDLFNFL